VGFFLGGQTISSHEQKWFHPQFINRRRFPNTKEDTIVSGSDAVFEKVRSMEKLHRGA
jgi:hypothetical protein